MKAARQFASDVATGWRLYVAALIDAIEQIAQMRHRKEVVTTK